MATFTPIYTFVPGAVTNADNYCANLYSPGAVGTFVNLNGNLQADNWPLLSVSPPYRFRKEDIQRGVLTGGEGRSGTANLDYFSDWFRGVVTNPKPSATNGGDQIFPAPTNTADNLTDRYIPIPGGAITFELTEASSDVIVTWTILWGNDSDEFNHHSFLRLFVNGEPVNDQVRQAPRNIAPGTGAFISITSPQTLDRSRYWSGHHAITDMEAGEHTVSLRILAHNNIKQTRVWARSLRYFRFTQ